MKPALILITASPALAVYWSESLQRPGAVSLPDLATLAMSGEPADSTVLLDLALPAVPASLTAECAGRYRLVALSSSPADDEGMRWLEQGAAGYAHAMSTPDLLQQVVETVEMGGTWVGRSIMLKLCARFGSRPVPAAAQTVVQTRLSSREGEVVQALRKGKSNKEIARELDISERTVKAHLTSVFQKFGVEDRLQLMLKLTSA